MIARVADRGHSFKGAGQYYLHDKDASTDERVAWTYIHNIAADDPEKAMQYMAFTAMHADHLKREAGVAACGRKSTLGAVYSFSLSWSPEEAPMPEQMKQAGLDTLEYLQLIEHEAVMVAHQDTDHPHIHVIANLVNPVNGRTMAPAYDYLTLSKWAEAYERENGIIYCQQRVINNELRREQALDGRQLGLVKHREAKHAKAELIQQLYQQSDNGKAFSAALSEQGLTLAKGDRRGFVLVDERGKISSLSRQVKGQRAADIRARLQDLVMEELPMAKEVSVQRQHQYQTTPTEKEKPTMTSQTAQQEKAQTEQLPAVKNEQKPKQTGIEEPLERNRHFLSALDRKRAEEEKKSEQISLLEARQKVFYQRQETIDQIAEIEKRIPEQSNMVGRFSGRLQALIDQKESLKKNLESINQRIYEQRQALEEKSHDEKQPSQEQDNSPEQSPNQDLDHGLTV